MGWLTIKRFDLMVFIPGPLVLCAVLLCFGGANASELSLKVEGEPELTMRDGTIGNNYAVEYTADLTSGLWQSITNQALETSSNTWADATADGSDGRFYRVRPAILQNYNPPPASQNELPVLTSNAVLMSYERLPVENNWHEGSIIPGTTTELAWSNAAGVVWNLIPDYPNQVLLTDGTCPYPGQNFELYYVSGLLAGFHFQGSLYSKVGAQVPVFESSSMHGYMGARYTTSIPSGYEYGFSFYSAIWSLVDKPLAGFQIGLPGTWLIPDNTDFYEPLLPPDNPMRILSPERAPNYWRGVFQTIEGGGGFWGSTQFPSAVPKYRMNGSIDGYIHEVSSPGWGFGRTTALEPEAMGIAQLSNRLLVPPDGLTFDPKPGGEFLGYAWMALPLVPAGEGVGDQSWTCFISASNFKGALAFYVPEIWERYAEVYPTVLGRGLDVRPGLVGPFTMELGAVPMKLQASNTGTLYARLPRLLFPTNGTDKTYLAADMARYSKAAIFNAVGSWFSGGPVVSGRFNLSGRYVPSLGVNPLGFSHGPENQKIQFSQFVQTAILNTPRGGQAFGLQWSTNSTPGVLPEYLVQTPAGLDAVATNEMPEEILLPKMDFALATDRGPYTSPSSWNTPAPASAANTVTLSDGSRVKYAWYKFVDQPSVQYFGWSAAEEQEIQSRIELIHSTWSTKNNFMEPPTGGVLATLDPALFVTPPPGLEIGYVPIVLEQSKP